MFTTSAKKFKATIKQQQKKTQPTSRQRSESAKNQVNRSSSRKLLNNAHYLSSHQMKIPSDHNSVYGSIQTTMVSNRDVTSKPLDHSKMEQQVQAFDYEKVQLINLYKLQIQQFKKKYEHKCDELEKIDADFTGRKNYVNSQIQELITKEKEVKIYIDKGKQQKMALQNDQQTLINGRRQLGEREEFVQQCLNKLETQRQVLEMKEKHLLAKDSSLTQKKMQVSQRDQDAQRLLIKINDTKTVQDQFQDTLDARKRDLDVREAAIQRKEQELAGRISAILNHDQVLNNLEIKLNEKVNQMQGFDEKLFKSLLENKYPIRKSVYEQMLLK